MGGHRYFTFTQREFADAQDGAYWLGFGHGTETAREEMREDVRDEIRREIDAELAVSDDCELCKARREIAALEQRAAVLQDRLEELKAQRRGHAIANGRASYRETRTPEREGNP